MKILGKIIFYLILIGVLGYLLVTLFFQKEFEELREKYFHSAATDELISEESLTIAYAFGTDTLEPTIFDPATRNRTLNIYESLVQTDRNLQPKPGLALSWGRKDDMVWEFKLRPGVKFHDGSDFDADDVIESFNRAITFKQSELQDLLNTIEKVEKVDDLTIEIYTKQPDPILVNRIATVLVFPSEMNDFTKPIGTCGYKYTSMNENELVLARNDDYWAGTPTFKNVFIKTIPNRFERLDAIKEGQVDILANVPPSFAHELENHESVVVSALPSLEVNFLIFNFSSDLLSDKRIREAITMAFDKNIFIDSSMGYAKASNQFISNGIFGFNPEIEESRQDTVNAKKILRQYDPFKRPSVTIDMIQGTEVVGQFIKDQLDEVGFSTNINILPWEELREKILKKESEMYFLGWRSEIGDASGYFENAVYSKGNFNGGGFVNKKVDQLIELSIQNLDEKKRLEQFHEIMKIITEEELIGVPLFESDIIYGIRVGVQFNPRLDGYVLAAEVTTSPTYVFN